MLPAHVHAFGVNFRKPGRVQQMRTRAIHWIRVEYTRILIRVLRRPRLSLGLVLLFMAVTFSTLGAGMIRFEFFAFDPVRLFPRRRCHRIAGLDSRSIRSGNHCIDPSAPHLRIPDPETVLPVFV